MLNEYSRGTIITVTAIPDQGYEFHYWSGDKSSIYNPDTLIMNEDRHIMANFRSLVTGIAQSSKASFRAFPNPVDKELNLELSSLKNNQYELILIDSQGNAVMTLPKTNSNSGKQSYDVSNLPSGVYFVRLDIKDSEEDSGGILKLIKL
jgi:hypothetical protein